MKKSPLPKDASLYDTLNHLDTMLLVALMKSGTSDVMTAELKRMLVVVRRGLDAAEQKGESV